MGNVDVINVGFAVFCSECNSELRGASNKDYQSIKEFCGKCGKKQLSIIGLRITASSENARLRAKRLIEDDPNLEDILYDVLSQFILGG